MIEVNLREMLYFVGIGVLMAVALSIKLVVAWLKYGVRAILDLIGL